MWTFGKKLELPTADEALRGRDEAMQVPALHAVLGTPLVGPWAPGLEVAYFGMGCFWGSEELYWQVPGVVSTAVGYQGGMTPNPTYEEACSGRTGHTESVQVVYDPTRVSYEELLKVFWEHHDPTSGMRQGNDIGTQYRSALYTTTEGQLKAAQASRETYQEALNGLGYDPITTEILPAGPFYYAEPYHQQYLHKNPNGYRCHADTGVPYPG
jgi:peptide-methionine (S)-S-oxide reductase